MKNIKKENYERIEITFSKLNESEIEVYKFILEQSKMLGKGKYIKNLIYEKMKATEK
ncbi:hypothetical protein LGL08_20250 [Clostridium estertheticum]|uniref:hypothetical protein n=1 Tax=Clostridium estertheticum TaxID=238834 RepID=UPI001CF239CB|nr:hypothetical protein [Clostridium estertheticum]MCB2309038.1 hypothetical protein [Clostridium estertheticum]MCB2346828.1 hypothetical protein [Clostridium estertheticum]MCB2351860.1 hypothetical protein [Clostridium estertheticum]WAG48388.1 hypothetical protein LL127_23055 [Clostridium estertheticum]